MDASIDGYEVLAGDPGSSVILHVPHSATFIPRWVREKVLLDDLPLSAELVAMTDAHTDQIAAHAAATASHRPWTFVNRVSRLVVDPERFPDEREEMNRVGMGAVYTRTSTGGILREDDPTHRRALLDAYFHPYAAALTRLVDDRLAVTGWAVILDVHSYPRVALPYELHCDGARPAICLGVDDQHTPAWLRDAAHRAFADFMPAVNTPFAGTYVPLSHYGTNAAVSSLMVEIRRDVYQSKAGDPMHAGGLSVAAALSRLIESVSTLDRP